MRLSLDAANAAGGFIGGRLSVGSRLGMASISPTRRLVPNGRG
jgi:hypothetical protein